MPSLKDKSILIVDDEVAMCELIETALSMHDCRCHWCGNAEDALKAMNSQDFDVVLTDIKMPGKSGLDLCNQIHQLRPDVPVIVMTAFGTLETAVEAIRSGAYDFVTKPFELELLTLTVQRAARHRDLTRQIKMLEQQDTQQGRFGSLVGQSETMRRLRKTIEKVSRTDASILITGESGTGKELIAKSIHQNSSRVNQPFVAINCGALSESLLESELFGHVKGSFTNASENRKGLFLESQGGTLFLDEIGEMPNAMQVKLLRALEESRVRPVGSDQEIPFNVRLLTATHRDLESAVESGTFREDLFYRINVIQLYAPTLRSRGSDILLLAHEFLKQFSEKNGKPTFSIANPAAEKLMTYSWPGNVRELRNVIERAVTLTRYDTITLEDLPRKIIEHKGDNLYIGGQDPGELVPLSDIENQYIQHVLKVVKNNRTIAAKILGLDRKTLYRRLKSIESSETLAPN
ncbi:sigma-54 dependent transcriptional regulator [bacterium]|nr:sigma-54 dependent transcriptional regulator [bacterium]MDC0295421.1 sigma-54 dependent transcriptional regulator [bacterium]